MRAALGVVVFFLSPKVTTSDDGDYSNDGSVVVSLGVQRVPREDYDYGSFEAKPQDVNNWWEGASSSFSGEGGSNSLTGAFPASRNYGHAEHEYPDGR